MALNDQLLQALAAVQCGETRDRKTMDQLVVHSLVVAGSVGYTVSWVGRIALEAYQVGRGSRIVAA